jgi:hypothetical protein
VELTQEIHNKAAKGFGDDCVVFGTAGIVAYAFWGSTDLGWWNAILIPVFWFVIPIIFAIPATYAFKAIVKQQRPWNHIAGWIMLAKPVWIGFLGWLAASFAASLI